MWLLVYIKISKYFRKEKKRKEEAGREGEKEHSQPYWSIGKHMSKEQWNITSHLSVIKKTRGNKCWLECKEKRTLVHWWWGCKYVQPLLETAWRFLGKLKIEQLYNPAIPLLHIFPKDMKLLSQKDSCIPLFTAAFFIIAKIQKQTVSQWVNE